MKKVIQYTKLAHKLNKLDEFNIEIRSTILGIIATSKAPQDKVNDIGILIRHYENSILPDKEKRINKLLRQ